MDFLPSPADTNALGMMMSDSMGWLIGLFAINVIGSLCLRSHALRVRAKKPNAAIWFTYQRRLSWLQTTSWIWIVVAISLVDISWLKLLFELETPLYWLVTANLLYIAVPPVLFGLVRCIVSHRVAKEVAQLDYSLSEVVASYAVDKGTILLSVLLLPLPLAVYQKSSLSPLGIFIILLISFGALTRLKTIVRQALKLDDKTPYAVTTGKLRDRLFALAKSAGVELNQLYVLPRQRSRTTNAFALKNNTVMITDYLLSQLTKAEVDSVMAHELAHLQLQHPQKMMWIVLGIPALIVMLAINFLTISHLWILISFCFLAICIVSCARSRQFEYAADARAVTITKDPKSLITGLVKVAKLSQMPLQCGKFSELFGTHPSMQRRIEAIAKANNISTVEQKALVYSVLSAAIQEVPIDPSLGLSASPLTPERYAEQHAKQYAEKYEPDDWQEEQTERIFSSAQKQKLHNRLLLCVLSSLVILPNILGHLIHWQLPTPGLRWLGYLLATGIVIIAYLAICNFVPVWGYSQLKQQFFNRLHTEGFDLSDARFIGFSPDSEPRIYEGCSNWDIGFLLLQSDHLYYLGEQTRFVLKAAQITRIEADIDKAGLPQQGALSLTWQSDDLASHQIRFQMLEAKSVRETVWMARSLQAQLEDWQSLQIATNSAAENTTKQELTVLRPPEIKEVTSHPLSPFSLGASLFLLVVLWVLSTALALLTGGYLELFPFIYFIPIVGIILQAIPSIRRDYRKRQSNRTDSAAAIQ